MTQKAIKEQRRLQELNTPQTVLGKAIDGFVEKERQFLAQLFEGEKYDQWKITLYIGLGLSLVTLRWIPTKRFPRFIRNIYGLILWIVTVIICLGVLTFNNTYDADLFSRVCIGVFIANFVGYMIVWNLLICIASRRI